MHIELSVDTSLEDYTATDIVKLLKSIIDLCEKSLSDAHAEEEPTIVSGSGQTTTKGRRKASSSFILRIEPQRHPHKRSGRL